MRKINFDNFIQLMKLSGFSRKTIDSYLHYNKELLKFANKSPRNINQNDIKSYLENLVDKGFSSSSLNLAYSAFKKYYGHIYKRRFFINLPRVKKKKKLPVVLARKEVEKMINSLSNIKHKTILSLLYGCGLRISEVVKIKMRDIDIERGLLVIRESKGGKDRRVAIPQKIINILKTQKDLKTGQDYLFTGRGGIKPLTVMSINKIVKQAAKKAGIKKSVSAHTLRHSFATHLLEKGIDIRYIQELLGHIRLETTQIYTKVAGNKIKTIGSPLD